MAARTPLPGEWSSPTREITTTHLIRLINETRPREVVVERVHVAPIRPCPPTALERLEPARGSGMLIDLRSFAEPDAPASEDQAAAPAPGPATPPAKVEPETATLTYASMMNHAMPPTPAPAQRMATGARRGWKRVASVRLLLCLGMLAFLCLGVLVLLGLDRWGMTDASLYVSLGL